MAATLLYLPYDGRFEAEFRIGPREPHSVLIELGLSDIGLENI